MHIKLKTMIDQNIQSKMHVTGEAPSLQTCVQQIESLKFPQFNYKKFGSELTMYTVTNEYSI